MSGDAGNCYVDLSNIESKLSSNLQLAETRVGNLRQELQIKFGYYAEIRRMATGILQAVDAGFSESTSITGWIS
ncbi:MAG: hypothetical protein ACP5US_11330 [Candidatus Kryptoniota bacterium]